MIDEKRFPQYGFPRDEVDILGITIHEISDSKSASELFDYYNSNNKQNEIFHYICDDKDLIELMPDNYAIYHIDTKRSWGNLYTIAIGICSSLDNQKYDISLDKAINLMKELKEKYNIPNDMIYFHNNFNEKNYCPKTLMNRYGSVKRFIIEKMEV